MKLILISIAVCLIPLASFAKENAKQCPTFLKHEFKRLHSSEQVNLCNLYKGKPLLFVNTASHCGFTKQFKPLEGLYQKYKSEGFEIIGFASNDFNQAAKSEEKAASICYKNYGVTFTMLAPTKVKGESANPVFTWLANNSGKQPSWNFNKYLVSADGTEVEHYGSTKKPLDGDLEKDLATRLQ